MRFSEMMGSGTERGPELTAESETDAFVVDALAPYLGTGTGVAAAPVVPVAPADTVVPVERAVVEDTAPTIADFTPLSDDLLPRRR